MDRPHGRTAFRSRALRRPRREEAAAADRRLRTTPRNGLPAAAWSSPWPRSATASVPPTGFRTTIRRCPRSSRTAAGRKCAPAPCATIRTARAARKTRRSRATRSAYFVQQMNDFKNGNRKSAEPRKANTNAMIAIAKAMTDEEIKATRRVLRLDAVDAVDQGGGDRHGAQDPHLRRPVSRARRR